MTTITSVISPGSYQYAGIKHVADGSVLSVCRSSTRRQTNTQYASVVNVVEYGIGLVTDFLRPPGSQITVAVVGGSR